MVRQLALHNMFQSTLPHGERLQDAGVVRLALPFQSTLPHGERPYAYNTYDYKACMMLFLRKIYFVCHIPKKHIAILIKDSKSIHAKEE